MMDSIYMATSQYSPLYRTESHTHPVIPGPHAPLLLQVIPTDSQKT